MNSDRGFTYDLHQQIDMYITGVEVLIKNFTYVKHIGPIIDSIYMLFSYSFYPVTRARKTTNVKCEAG